jgi:FixJ family two-component response regulator
VSRIEIPRVIAIVAGNPQTFQALSDWLNSLRISVSAFSTAEDLVAAMCRKGIHPVLSVDDLSPQPSRLVGAVLDVNLAGISGFDLARALKRWYPTLPVVVVTDPGCTGSKNIFSIQPGIRTVSRQPFALDAFKEAMFSMLGRAN